MSDRISRVAIIERPELVGRLPADLQACGARVFIMGRARIIVSEEPTGWHLSISHHDRDPSWDEIATARYRLLPSKLTFVMLLPPLSEYINIHRHTFHLWEDPPRLTAAADDPVAAEDMIITMRLKEYLDLKALAIGNQTASDPRPSLP